MEHFWEPLLIISILLIVYFVIIKAFLKGFVLGLLVLGWLNALTLIVKLFLVALNNSYDNIDPTPIYGDYLLLKKYIKILWNNLVMWEYSDAKS